MKTMCVLAVLLVLVMSSSDEVLAESEEATVQHVITAVADAVTAFPHTKDRQSVLKFFMQNFSSIDDVERGSIQTLENTLTEIEKDLAKESLMMTEKISNITVHVSGTVAWATYNDVLTLARQHGTVEEEALCTAILRKTDAGWFYQHEHCSAYPTQPETELRDGSQLTRHERSVAAGNNN
jgi:ketosteroid isomerase-like protein